jgi:hypothetical protein
MDERIHKAEHKVRGLKLPQVFSEYETEKGVLALPTTEVHRGKD